MDPLHDPCPAAGASRKLWLARKQLLGLEADYLAARAQLEERFRPQLKGQKDKLRQAEVMLRKEQRRSREAEASDLLRRLERAGAGASEIAAFGAAVEAGDAEGLAALLRRLTAGPS